MREDIILSNLKQILAAAKEADYSDLHRHNVYNLLKNLYDKLTIEERFLVICGEKFNKIAQELENVIKNSSNKWNYSLYYIRWLTDYGCFRFFKSVSEDQAINFIQEKFLRGDESSLMGYASAASLIETALANEWYEFTCVFMIEKLKQPDSEGELLPKKIINKQLSKITKVVVEKILQSSANSDPLNQWCGLFKYLFEIKKSVGNSTIYKFVSAICASSDNSSSASSSDDDMDVVTDSKDETTEMSIVDAGITAVDVKLRTRTHTSDDEGYETDTEETFSYSYRKRLLLGEGRFNFSKALLEKHKRHFPGLARAITVTEFRTLLVLINDYGKEVVSTLFELYRRGATLHLGVNAATLDEQDKFKGKRYRRIQFNFPFADGDLKENGGDTSNRKNTKALTYGFFKSASKLQSAKDQIHISFNDDKNDHWQQTNTYDIVQASLNAEYKLIKVRKFGTYKKDGDFSDKVTRYKGYEPQHTKGLNLQDADKAHEFVFEKQQSNSQIQYPTDKIMEDIVSNAVCKEIKVEIDNKNQQYFEYNSTEESSSYTTDTETEIKKTTLQP